MKRFRSEKIPALFLKGLIALVVWGVIAFGVWKYLGDEWRPTGDVTVFDPEVKLYTAEFPFMEPPPETVYIREKAVVVDVTDLAVLPLTFSLPSDIAAIDPVEVGTVIQVERLFEQVGTYGDQTPAYQQNVLVRLVDLGLGCTLGEAFIEGGLPPKKKEGDGPAFGNPPDDQIPQLVAGLPHITWDGDYIRGNAPRSTARGGLPTGHRASELDTPRFRTDGYMRRADTSSSQPATVAQAPKEPDIVNPLVKGMSMDDAIAYLGEPQSRAMIGSGDRSITRCTWRLPDGRSLICNFGTKGLKDWEVQ